MNEDDMCTNCGTHPRVSGHNVCSQFCLNEAAEKLVAGMASVAALKEQQLCKRCKQRKKSQETDDDGLVVLHEYCGILCYHASQKAVTLPTAVTPFAPPSAENTVSLRRENLSFPFMQRISQRMKERWVSDGTELSSLEAIYSIKVSNEVYQRFNTALEMNDNHTIVTSYYGGTVACQIADCRDKGIRPCKSKSCAPCNAINSAFSNILFGEPSHDGVYGPGIYTHLNPVIAHQISVTCNQQGPQRSSHSILQCRVVTANGATARFNSYAGSADELGIVFCSHAIAIIPSHLLIYKVKTEFPLPVCKLRDCNKPIPTNESRFCSNQHREDAEQALKDERQKKKELTTKLAPARKAAPPPEQTADLPDLPPSQTRTGLSEKPQRRRANPLPGPANGILPDEPDGRPTTGEEDNDLPPGQKTRRSRGSGSASDDLALPDDLPEFPPWDPNQGFGPGPGSFPPQPNYGWGHQPQPVPPVGPWPGPYNGFAPYGVPPQPGQSGFAGPQLPLCILKGCDKPVHEKDSKFCSNQHRKDAVTKDGMPACILCKEYPRAISQFCGQSCLGKAQGQAPMLISVDQKDPMFSNIVNQFDISWRHSNKTKPTVAFVYKIVLNKQLSDSYLAYQNKVESEGNFKAQGKQAGNECRRWHGTKRLCNIGDNPASPTLCVNTACPMCSILRTSFQVAKANVWRRGINRPGRGVCASPRSSRAHDYQSNAGPVSQYSMIMLTDVILGQGYKLAQDSRGLTSLPNGYHSVLEETGGSLSYDEVIVYNDDAIRPSWLVVYK